MKNNCGSSDTNKKEKTEAPKGRKYLHIVYLISI